MIRSGTSCSNSKSSNWIDDNMGSYGNNNTTNKLQHHTDKVSFESPYSVRHSTKNKGSNLKILYIVLYFWCVFRFIDSLRNRGNWFPYIRSLCRRPWRCTAVRLSRYRVVPDRVWFPKRLALSTALTPGGITALKLKFRVRRWNAIILNVIYKFITN